MTGAPVPPGAEAIVPVEWTDGGLGRGPATTMRAHRADPAGATGLVRIHRSADRGAHVRVRGSDVGAGELVLAAGTRLGPPQIGLLAAIGRGQGPGAPAPAGRGALHRRRTGRAGRAGRRPARSTTPTASRLAAAAQRGRRDGLPGRHRRRTTRLRCSPRSRTSSIRADLIVTSGGVSVGAYDVVKEAARGGAGDRGTVDFRQVAMQPGKPQGFGVIGPAEIPIFALPGNPVSSYVSFELFVRPASARCWACRRCTARRYGRRCAEPVAGSPAGDGSSCAAVYHGGDGAVTPVGGAGLAPGRRPGPGQRLIVVPERVTEVARTRRWT